MLPRRQLRSLLLLICAIVLTAANPVVAADSTCASQTAGGSTQSVVLGDWEYFYERELDRPESSSAFVYLSLDEKHVVKFYPEVQNRYSARSQSAYEYWAGRYLASKGLPVDTLYEAPVYAPDTEIGTGYWVARKFEPGPTGDEIEELAFRNSRKKIFGKTAAEHLAKLKQIKQKARELYSPTELLMYMEMHGVNNPLRLLTPFPPWRKGDFYRNSNWSLNARGQWRLIDP